SGTASTTYWKNEVSPFEERASGIRAVRLLLHPRKGAAGAGEAVQGVRDGAAHRLGDLPAHQHALWHGGGIYLRGGEDHGTYGDGQRQRGGAHRAEEAAGRAGDCPLYGEHHREAGLRHHRHGGDHGRQGTSAQRQAGGGGGGLQDRCYSWDQIKEALGTQGLAGLIPIFLPVTRTL